MISLLYKDSLYLKLKLLSSKQILCYVIDTANQSEIKFKMLETTMKKTMAGKKHAIRKPFF